MTPELQVLVDKLNSARRRRDFVESDQVMEQILELGVNWADLEYTIKGPLRW